jgi:F0F1-type ATP synthase membrane subunit c/vacuolar-type H+-ATPase subunit K
MPLTKMDDDPAFAASSMGEIISAGNTCQGYCRNTAALPTTFTPAARIRR